MKIGIITQWYPPELGVRVPAAIARGLAHRGHEVQVLTGIPNYPSGQVYPGHRVRPYRRERDGSIVVHRAPLVPSHNNKAAGRAANYLSFAVGATGVALARVTTPDVWLVYSSPATAAMPLLVPGLRARPTALLIQDLWPDSVTDSSFAPRGVLGSVMERTLAAFVSSTYRRADAIGVISPGMRATLVDRGVPADRILLTPNWVDDPVSTTTVGEHRIPSPPGSRLFLYAGNLGDLQALRELIENWPDDAAAQLVLMGEGLAAETLSHRADRLHNVRVLPRVPLEIAQSRLAHADALVVSLRDTPLLRATMPSKVQEYLAIGRPVLAHAAGDVAELVEASGAGLSATPGDRAALHRTIAGFLGAPASQWEAWGRAGRQHYLDHYTTDKGLDGLERLLDATLQGQR